MTYDQKLLRYGLTCGVLYAVLLACEAMRTIGPRLGRAGR